MLWMFHTLPGVEFAACTHPIGSAQKLDEHYCVKTMDNIHNSPSCTKHHAMSTYQTAGKITSLENLSG